MQVYTETSEKHITFFLGKIKTFGINRCRNSSRMPRSKIFEPSNCRIIIVVFKPADPDSSSSNTTDTTTSPPPTKKTCHAENLVDRTIVKLKEEIKKLGDVLRLELVTNSDKTLATLKLKKNELNAAIKRKNVLKCNRQNEKLSRDRQKEKNITGNNIFSRIMLESWIIWGRWNKWVERGRGGGLGLCWWWWRCVCVCARACVCVCVCVCVCEGWQKNILEIYAGVFKCAEFLYLWAENCLTPISKLEFNSNLRWMVLEMAQFLLLT